MTVAIADWDNESGFWQVEDECGYQWEVVTTGNPALLIQRRDSQRYYGAVYVPGAAGGPGTIDARQEGDVEDGYDCGDRYTFHSTTGWVAAGRDLRV